MTGIFAQAHNDYLDVDNYLDEPDNDQLQDDSLRTVALIKNRVGELNPRAFYRTVYKYGAGLTIGFCVNGKWIYNDELPEKCEWVGNIDDIDIKAGKIISITGVAVSSIIEGLDVEVPERKLEGRFLPGDFETLLNETEEKVRELFEKGRKFFSL